MRGEPTSVFNADGKEVNFGSVYFDPYCVDGSSPFLYRRRVAADSADRLISVVDLLSRRWRHCSRGHGVRALKRVETCRRAIHDYEAFIVFCETNDLTEVRETFIRINSLGMRIGAADKAFARASKFNLRALVRDAQPRSVQRMPFEQEFARELIGPALINETEVHVLISSIDLVAND